MNTGDKLIGFPVVVDESLDPGTIKFGNATSRNVATETPTKRTGTHAIRRDLHPTEFDFIQRDPERLDVIRRQVKTRFALYLAECLDDGRKYQVQVTTDEVLTIPEFYDRLASPLSGTYDLPMHLRPHVGLSAMVALVNADDAKPGETFVFDGNFHTKR